MGDQVQKARELQLIMQAIIYQKKKSCQNVTLLFCTNLVTN